ncbi:MAG: ligase-associated DNA damage response exonuclease [Chitinophagaceae bacterium]|nr:ligase-associated DNA damage response exonuclease [Chitinophagaceae bacterium]
MPLIEFSDKGLFCRQGNFYIDPWKPVDYAIITHAHSDHARWGMKHYLCHTQCKPLLQLRLGDNNYQTLEWEETLLINGVQVSLHPAGHMIGSSQVRLEYQGEVWVVSGDYKVEDDGLSGRFEPVRCHTFITESTFGLPIYHWQPQHMIFQQIQDWIRDCHAKDKVPVLFAYSLGKAQRLLQCLPEVSPQIYVHGAIYNAQDALLKAGWALPDVHLVSDATPRSSIAGNVVLAPGSADGSPWLKRFGAHETGVCSGWMQVRGHVRRRNVDAGFALSDHADWPGLLQAIRSTGASRVYVTHGFQAALSRYLTEHGLDAAEVRTEFGDEEEGIAPLASTQTTDQTAPGIPQQKNSNP